MVQLLQLRLVVEAVEAVAIQELPPAEVHRDLMARLHLVTMLDKTVPTKPAMVVAVAVAVAAGEADKAEPAPGVIKAGWLDHMV
jgi:hypothetical protein